LSLAAGALCLMGTLLVLAVGVSLAGSGRSAAATVRRAAAERRVVIGGSQELARASITAPRSCQPTSRASGYLNPLARARVTSERIDQGVDYAGRGRLAAIGTGKVTYVRTEATGWPGAFIEYRLLSGPDAGCFVYYAEGVNPVARLHVGEAVAAGQTIATIVPGWSTGIEIGWGAGRSTKTLAQQHGGWTQADDDDNVASRAGRSFSALITELGGPSGRVEN
jgi:hypothetical protein